MRDKKYTPPPCPPSLLSIARSPVIPRNETQLAQLEDAKAELAWLEAEGEARRLEKSLAEERESLRKLRLFCQSKAREEISRREEAVSRYGRTLPPYRSAG